MMYDPAVKCCCSAEEHLSGEYVLHADYQKLLERIDSLPQNMDKLHKRIDELQDK